MFEISKNISITLEIFDNSKIYIIDNFYHDPDSVLNFFLQHSPDLWKKNEIHSYNSIYFEDKRHTLYSDKISKVYDFLTFLCGEYPYNGNTSVMSNAVRFFKNSFNDYKNNYWWPHKDVGYTSLVYFNHLDEISGTNLYENLDPDNEPPQCSEHFCPWRSKNKFRIIKTLYPRYNRMVLFDGSKFFHGMNICNDDYFGENYRFNQVFFLNPNI